MIIPTKKNTILYYIFSRILGKYFSFLSKHSPANIILAYHGVGYSHPLCIPPKVFREQMEYVATSFKVVDIEEILTPHTTQTICITFDDAYINVLQNAIPVLSSLCVPAIVYIPVGYIGKSNLWDRYLNFPLLEIMDKHHLEKIVKMGYKIGCHSFSHSRQSNLNLTQLENEIGTSKKILEDMLSIGVANFAYPFGMKYDYDERAFEILETYHYHTAVGSHFGRYNYSFIKYSLNRITILPEDDIDIFKLKLSGAYDWIAYKENLSYYVKKMFFKIRTDNA